MTLVIDASVTLDWCFDSERSAYGEAALLAVGTAHALVPPIWGSEVANALLRGVRQGRMTRADAAHSVHMLTGLDMRTVALRPADALRQAHETGARFNLSGYDASYLALAMQEGVPLATNDDALRRAAEAAGVPLFGLTQEGAGCSS